MNRLQQKRAHDPFFFPCVLILPSTLSEGKVFLGDIHSLDDQEMLIKEQIKNIISCGKECNTASRLGSLAKTINILMINVKDSQEQDISQHFQESYNFIQKGRQEGSVLVHCMAGISRSSAILIAYIMRRFHINFPSAQLYVKDLRKKINPNEGFRKQLQKYQQTLGVAQIESAQELEEMKENIQLLSNATSKNASKEKTISRQQSQKIIREKAPIVKVMASPQQQKAQKMQTETIEEESSRRMKTSESRKSLKSTYVETDPRKIQLQKLNAQIAYFVFKFNSGHLYRDY